MESVLGPNGELQAGCNAGAGLYGYPETSDPWAHWLDTFFGGKSMDSASNIIFSNGLLDPWSGAGVYAEGSAPYPELAYTGPTVQNITADGSVQALILDLGAHHLDLMFMDDNDPECAIFAREVELAAIKKWAA
uniref:Uncharacterized protein n=1 Tax=Florenciella parvula TaxID=236787 RepID=A0A7S2BG01_9STRA